MIPEFASKTPVIILEKMNLLLAALRLSWSDFEKTAWTISNKQLRYTLLGLAQESRQYANEIKSHIESLGGDTSSPAEEPGYDFSGLSDKKEWEIRPERDLFRKSGTLGNLLIESYAKLLEEPIIYEGLKERVRYQLNGLLHLFSQLSLLNASMEREA